MASPVSKNVAAALGLVPAVLDGVRRLPGKAVQLPVIAVGHALNGIDAAKKEYDGLADRGERLIARLRGLSLDEVEDAVEDLGKTAARAVTNVNKGSTANARSAMQAAVAKAQDRAEATEAIAQVAPVQETLPVAVAASTGAPSTGALLTGAPSTGRVDSAAAPEVVEQVDRIASNVDAPLITDHSELPLADYDHMTLGALRGRLRSLDMQQLVQLRDYEKSKADRLPIVTMLDNRIAKLSNGESVPTGTDAAAPSAKVSTPVTPPKQIGKTAVAKNDNSPPHGKVRLT